jgi:hypothetical protein
MNEKQRLVSVNEFLSAVYGAETRLSTLLAGLGHQQDALVFLRDHCLDQVMVLFVAKISERLEEYDDGERKYFILSRRFGLDGQPPATLATLGRELAISRERVRQLEESTLRRCRFRKNRDYWLEALDGIARSLLTSHGQAIPFSPAVVTEALPHAMPASDDEPQSTITSAAPLDLGAVIAGVLKTTGEGLGDHYLAKVLGGELDPVTEALVLSYSLQWCHGSFADQVRKILLTRIHDIRVARVRASVEPSNLARAVGTVLEAVGSGLSNFYLASVLCGGNGPTTRALVGQYHLESVFGLYAGLDRQVLEALVREVRTSQSRDLIPSDQVAAAVVAVINVTPARLRAEYIAKVLGGDRGPVVEALVHR